MGIIIHTACKYFEDGECNGYYKVNCPYQDVDYNYVDFTTGHKEINVVNCTSEVEDGNDDR